MPPFRILFIACLALTHMAPMAFAHDLWIEASPRRAAQGMPIKLRLWVGQDFKGEPLPRNESLIQKFSLVGPEGERSVIGQDGSDPAGFVKAESQGLHTVVYLSRFSRVELDGAKFESYLKDEGLEAISKVRASKRETAKPAKDSFLRCAKAILPVGEGSHAGFDRVFGLPLELVAEADPISGAGPLPVRLLWQGRPLKGALVVAFSQANPKQKIRVRTDSAGRVRVPMMGRGAWLIKCVHMRPARNDSPGADWESYWASLTFERKA